MAEIRFKNVSKRFGDVVAVSHFDLNIVDGEFLVLVGPSGCGKSTVLRLLSGLEDVTEGEMYIGTLLVNDMPPKDRDIAMVFQSYALYPHMSVYDNMSFGLTLRKVPREEIDRRVKATARILGIEELLKRKPRQLSGGQRQRVALARAIVREPAAFLLDEPLSNLDAKLRVQTRSEISKLHQRLGTTFIYVTHDQIEAMSMADRIAVLDKGILQQVGTPRDLYENPQNKFVAGFIGSPAMNFFDVTVSEEQGTIYLDTGDFRVPIPITKSFLLTTHVGRTVTFGMRPEDIHPADYLPTGLSRTAVVQAEVDVTEQLGNELFVYLMKGNTRFMARVDPRTNARPGSEIDMIFDMVRMYAFDPATGTALTGRPA